MSKKWHKGPPPSIGWWPASDGRVDDYLRWWSGSHWSDGVDVLVTQFDPIPPSAKEASFVARRKDSNQGLIEWQHRPASWPKRSRT